MDTGKDSEQCHLQLEETEKKLCDLTKQLDSVLKCNSRLGVGMDYVIATVNELQSLMEWTSGKKELKADSGIIFQKLQQLERIQKELEKTAAESEQIRSYARGQKNSRSFTPTAKEDIQDFVDKCSRDTPSSSNSEHKSAKHVFFLENNLNNLDSKNAFENSTSVNIVPTDILVDLSTEDNDNSNLNLEAHNKLVEHKCICTSDNEGKIDVIDPLDSLGPSISEDEGLGEESRRGDSTGPSSYVEIQDTVSDIIALDLSHDKNPVLILPDDHQKNMDWINDSRDTRNSLELCMCAIGNLKESLRAKENELLKLSAIQNDQKQIAALQDVIINFHKDTAQLKSQLESTKKENSVLKEQVLELEEAENDARLQAQRLGEKLVFLQEKDSHFQAELAETKQSLEKCIEELTIKEMEELELRSQLKYVDALVQKYEDQIHTMEIVELALRKKLLEQEDEIKSIEKSIEVSKTEKCDRGTQTYPPPLKDIKLFDSSRSEEEIETTESSVKIENSSALTVSDQVNVNDQAPVTSLFPIMQRKVDCCVQTEMDVCSSLVQKQLESEPSISNQSRGADKDASIEDSNFLATSSVECPIQKELLKRLHQLVEEDANLQQQLHYVDQINLTLWKKLHNLEFHIGECKKRNMSDDCGSDSCIDSESCDLPSFGSRPSSRDQMREDSVSKCESPYSNKGIIACLDQSEQEIKDRLLKLEKINASFEKELELREKLYLEKERKYEEWVKTEQRFIGDLKRLEDERNSLSLQVAKLEKEKQELSHRVKELQEELRTTSERHRLETTHIKIEHQEMTLQLQKKIEQLLFKEKDHLKQITNLKLETGKNSDKTESEKLKSSYVELQLELSRTRDRMRIMEEDFRARFDEIRSKHAMEEARLLSEIDMLRNKNSECDVMIVNFQTRHGELINILKEKENELEKARLENKKSMDATEEEHRTIEAQLKSQLRQMEEGTAVTTRALTDERIRLEKELQENIYDLRSKEELYKARISELETNVSRLHEELHRITGDLDSGFESEVSNDNITSFRREKLMNQLRELRDRETELREKLDEMEQKEAAYRETLEHADRIVASVEQGYKNKIEELEISEKNLKQRVGHLEEVESNLRGALHKERRSSDGRKPDDLVVELMEAEVRENSLKEKIENLEQLQRNAMSKIKDLEKLRENLEAQLGDKDELSSTLKRNQQELEFARKSLTKLKKSENDLQTSLHQVEGVLASTEGQMKTRLRTMEEEKRGLEETVEELRNQVRDLKKKLDRNTEEDDDERMPIVLHSQVASSSGCPSKQNEDFEDIDYAEVDENDSLAVAQNVTGVKNVALVNKPKAVPQVMEKKTGPLSFSSFQKPQMCKEVAKITPTTRQDIAPKKEARQLVKSTSNISDSYDDARQNFEHCMMRAMAAMTMDLEKSKKLAKDHAVSRTQNISMDSSKSSNQKTSNLTVKEENDYDEILPRPTNFRVVQQVGSDTLLVGWEYVNTSVLEGFEVYVDGNLHETVYTPDRTKALVSGLNLNSPLRLSICALSHCGQMSEPEILQLPSPQERNSGFFFDDDDDEDEELFDDAVPQRPYSMEW